MIFSAKNILNDKNKAKGVLGAYLVGDLGNGGQERQLYNLIINLSSSQKIILIPWDFNQDDRYVQLLKKESNILLIDLGSKGVRSKLATIRKVLDLTSALYFHSYTYHLNFIAWAACVGTKRKSIGGVRNRLVLNRKLNGFVRFYLSLVFPYFRIANNYKCFDGLDLPTKALSKLLSKTLFVHNGIDTQRFKSLGGKNFETRPLRSISVGRLFPVKQVEQIIEWVASMKAAGVQIHHRHAGEGPELETLRQLVKLRGVEQDFIFAGNVDNIPAFMNEAQIFVHAARFEGCPNVIMEAMACGLPILSSNAGDTSIIVDHNRNGYVFEIDDQQMMLSYGLELASQSKRLESFAAYGQVKAQQKFGINQYALAVKKAYSLININI